MGKEEISFSLPSNIGEDNGTRLKNTRIITAAFTQGRREQRQYSAMTVAEEQSMIVCDTNDQSTREGGGRGNGKAMHAGPIRHSHKINQLARSFVRSF